MTTPRDLAIDALTTHRHGPRKEPCPSCASFYGAIFDRIVESGAIDAVTSEAEHRGRELGRSEVVHAIHQLCQSLPNDRYRSLAGDVTEVHITDRELGDLVGRFVSRPDLPGGAS